MLFLSTPSARRATSQDSTKKPACLFLSTPSARRATHPVFRPRLLVAISIHALREEGDLHPVFRPRLLVAISIHALREEGDQYSGSRRPSLNQFLSTPSARRATPDIGGGIQDYTISIHALREEGDCCFFAAVVVLVISIHALREEGDQPRILPTVQRIQFLSTPSARRATPDRFFQSSGELISIHALREEGDVFSPHLRGRGGKISIHALREEGDLRQKTSMWIPSISIHALREEGDAKLPQKLSLPPEFLSTPSARRATQQGC